ncbi:MAG: hypothetical protein LAO51_10525 [Acidobacteriia bacterium]|nr:hypothetical protein [Terriglobia bacterium]
MAKRSRKNLSTRCPECGRRTFVSVKAACWRCDPDSFTPDEIVRAGSFAAGEILRLRDLAGMSTSRRSVKIGIAAELRGPERLDAAELVSPELTVHSHHRRLWSGTFKERQGGRRPKARPLPASPLPLDGRGWFEHDSVNLPNRNEYFMLDCLMSGAESDIPSFFWPYLESLATLPTKDRRAYAPAFLPTSAWLTQLRQLNAAWLRMKPDQRSEVYAPRAILRQAVRLTNRAVPRFTLNAEPAHVDPVLTRLRAEGAGGLQSSGGLVIADAMNVDIRVLVKGIKRLRLRRRVDEQSMVDGSRRIENLRRRGEQGMQEWKMGVERARKEAVAREVRSIKASGREPTSEEIRRYEDHYKRVLQDPEDVCRHLDLLKRQHPELYKTRGFKFHKSRSTSWAAIRSLDAFIVMYRVCLEGLEGFARKEAAARSSGRAGTGPGRLARIRTLARKSIDQTHSFMRA